MHLTAVVKTLFLVILSLLSCNKSQELFPQQCDCHIETLQVSGPSLVTYQVSAHSNASVNSITYQTSKGKVTIEPDSIPFAVSVQLNKGDRAVLTATGNPNGGSIILGYEVQEKDFPTPRSSSTSRVWIVKDGTCQ